MYVEEQMITQEQAERAKSVIWQRYGEPLWGTIVSGVAVTTLDAVEAHVPPDKKRSWCVVVFFSEELPLTVEIPREYDGVPIFRRVAKIFAL